MNLVEVSIRRPVMTVTVMAAILFFGVIAYRQLPVSDIPNVDFPTINVRASLPGASPETMASAVATPLEKEFSTIAGVVSMSSASSLGNTAITLQFELSRDIDAAAQDVQAAISSTLRQLPRDMTTPPSYRKVNPAASAIMTLVLTSPTVPLSVLDEYGQTLIAQRLSMLDGVAQVEVRGSQKYAVRVRANPFALAARKLSLLEVADAIQKANVDLPTGVLWGPEQTFTLNVQGQLQDAAAYNDIVVAYRNGAPIRLADIAVAQDSVENDKLAAWYYTPEVQQRAIVLSIQRQPGANTLAVAAAIRKLLPVLRAQLPPTVSLSVLLDTSESISQSSQEVQFTLVLTIALVVLVIFLFLRSWSATLIPSITLPLSITGTFAVMYLCDYSLDNMSLMALTLALGFVVDDAVVMLENIYRHLEMHKTAFNAALDGAKEITFTIISMTFSLVTVFLPVLLMSGIVGRFFREFTMTIGFAVLFSALISLMLTPMLASRFLRYVPGHQHRPISEHWWKITSWTERILNRSVKVYARLLRLSLDHRRIVGVLFFVILGLTAWLYWFVPKGFLPSEDRDQIFLTTEAAEGVSFTAMAKLQKEVNEVLHAHPAVQEFVSSIGSFSGGAGNVGRGVIRLKPKKERTQDAAQVIQDLRRKLAAIPGVKAYLQLPLTVAIGGRMSKGQYQYTLLGPVPRDLYFYANKLLQRLKSVPLLQDVNSDLLMNNPEIEVEINREAAAVRGINIAQIENLLYAAYGSRQVSTIYTPNNQYAVILEVLPQYQKDLAALLGLYLVADDGDVVPLRSVASFKSDYGPSVINHSGQIPSVTLSFNLAPDASLGEAVAIIEKEARATLPGAITGSFQGMSGAFQESFRSMNSLLVVAIVVIYMILCILYEDFYHPWTILSSLPLAGFGALVTLLIFRVDLSLYAFMGIIMLIGLVKKNGIMMVDFALMAQREKGLPPREAIYEACLIRYRPIMMTTVAALVASIPIAFAHGIGSEARQPLGLAVMGGLLFSQTMTLFITPVVYIYIEKLKRRRQRGGEKSA